VGDVHRSDAEVVSVSQREPAVLPDLLALEWIGADDGLLEADWSCASIIGVKMNSR